MVLCRLLGQAVPVVSGFKMVRDWFIRELTAYAKDRGLEIRRLSNHENKEQEALQALENWRKRLVEEQGLSMDEARDTEGVFFIGKAQEKVKVLANSSEKEQDSGKRWVRLRWSKSMVNQSR